MVVFRIKPSHCHYIRHTGTSNIDISLARYEVFSYKRLLDCVHNLLKINQELNQNTVFRELALFPSTGDKYVGEGGGEAPTQLDRA
jgi:hypothetical protein